MSPDQHGKMGEKNGQEMTDGEGKALKGGTYLKSDNLCLHQLHTEGVGLGLSLHLRLSVNVGGIHLVE